MNIHFQIPYQNNKIMKLSCLKLFQSVQNTWREIQINATNSSRIQAASLGQCMAALNF